MKRLHLAVPAILAIAIAGCGGGGGSTPSSAPLPAPSASPASGSGSQAKASGTASFTIRIPVAGASSSSASRKRPAYVSPNTASVTFAVGGTVTNTVNIQAGVAPCGAPSGGTFTCTAQANVPAGQQTIVVTTYSATNGGGSVLSTNSVVQTIIAGANNPITLSLNGVVNALALVLSTNTVASGSTASVTATLDATDASTATIVGPGSLIDTNGNAVVPTLTNSDTSGEFVATENGAGTTSITWTIAYNGTSAVPSATFGISGTSFAVTPQTINVAALSASVSSITLNGTGTDSFTVTEANYSGSYTVVSNNTAAVTVTSPIAAGNGSTTIPLDAIGSGTAMITVTDSFNQFVIVPVTVTISNVTVQGNAKGKAR
jgi:hypothetical protein